MRSWFQRLRSRVYGWLGSGGFFYVIIGLFVFQSLWIALTARYPQAFDEDFHFGLIQLHATQWLPFFTHQPSGAEIHGAVARQPSYLYHYLFSLVYRLIQHFTSSIVVQIIVMRLINIGLFVGGLFVYRALLLRLNLSRRIVNVCLLFFVLTPVVPLLAANINYDNCIFLLTGLLFLSAVNFRQTLDRHHQINVSSVIELLIYGMTAALVKYTSLPLTVALYAILMWGVWRRLRKERSTEPLRLVWPRRRYLIATGFILLILGALMVERYGINLVEYHALSPDCAKVLSVKQCHSYAPWARDFDFAQTYPRPSRVGIIVYPFVWLHRMVFETMFTISARFGWMGLVEYIPAPPLTVANYTAWTLVITGLTAAAVYARRLWQQRYLRFLLVATLFYTAALYIKNFSMYLHAGEAVAIHGRYLIQVYPLLYATVILALSYFFDAIHRPRLKTSLVIVSLLLLTQGAGLITWIFRSDPSWYWSRGQHDLVYEINRPVQTVIHHIIIP